MDGEGCRGIQWAGYLFGNILKIFAGYVVFINSPYRN
jgi:hypothetical protein